MMMFLSHALLILLLATNVITLDLQKRFEKKIAEYVRTGNEDDLKEVYEELFKDQANDPYCTSCKIVANAAINLRKSGVDDKVFADFLKKMCNLFWRAGEQTCSGLIDIPLNSWLYILDHKNVTGERICSIRLQSKHCQDPTSEQWHINIPDGKPKLSAKKNPNGKAIKILQLSDVHYDPLYKPGNNAECAKSLCCGEDSGKPAKPDEAAGYWGDYRDCDIPWHTIKNALEEIKQRHPDIDRLYFTGDIVHHVTWATSVEANSYAMNKFIQELKDTFEDVPVYPILGNHESHPVDLFPPLDIQKDLSMQWLYDFIGDQWTRWLPEETKKTIGKGGYYTVLVKPDFRIITINNNVCLTNNAWLVYDDRDPLGQLQWFADTLFEAEKNEELVHILSHVPPGEINCMKQWSRQYKRIIERFHGIITGEFNGHTHSDELKVFYDPNADDIVIHVAFNGGSLTTFVANNPNYKVYYVDEKQNQVLEFESWTYDLEEANKNNTKPNWFKLYSFKNAFGMDNLDGDSFDKLLKRMSSDTNLLQQYERFRVRNSSKLVQENYDMEYLNKLLCDITATEYTYPEQCKYNFNPATEKSDL